MTIRLYESDMQAAACEATVVAVTDDNQVVLDQTVFYAQGGGQPGDIGTLAWQGGQTEVTNTTKGEEGAILHQLAEGAMKPVVGARVRASLDWDRRHRLMRMHTGLHLLCTVVGAPVTVVRLVLTRGVWTLIWLKVRIERRYRQVWTLRLQRIIRLVLGKSATPT